MEPRLHNKTLLKRLLRLPYGTVMKHGYVYLMDEWTFEGGRSYGRHVVFWSHMGSFPNMKVVRRV